jgi:hypothetical protein
LNLSHAHKISVVDQPPGTGFSYTSTDKYLHELDEVHLLLAISHHQLTPNRPGRLSRPRIHEKLLRRLSRTRRNGCTPSPTQLSSSSPLTLKIDLPLGRILRRPIHPLHRRRTPQDLFSISASPRYRHRQRLDRRTKPVPCLCRLCCRKGPDQERNKGV